MAAVVSIAVPPPTQFDPHGDPSTVGMRWEKWVRNFTSYATASGVQNDNQKRQLLLHCSGSEVQDIFELLPNAGATYDEAVNALNAHFVPRRNVTFNRLVFRKEKQKNGETVAQFATRLRQLTQACDYPAAQLTSYIRDQIVDGCVSESLRVKLLAEPNLTLDRTLEIAQAREASESQAQSLSGKVFQTRVTSAPQPRVSAQDSKNGKKTCSRCGKSGHLGHECRCSKNVTCTKCKKTGHFASMCRSKPKPNFNKPKPKNQKAPHQVQLVDDLEESDEYVYSTGSTSKVTVMIDRTPVTMVVDSGATCNVLNSSDTKKLKRNGLQATPCKRTIHPYGSPPLPANFEFTYPVKLAGSKMAVTDTFICVETNSPLLLGKDLSERLGIIRFDVQSVQEKAMSNTSDQVQALKEFPGIDTGIGCLKDHQVRLHIDSSIPPVARKHSRIPFHNREKVEQEINRLLKEEIIEPVSGPTEWVSRIVTPPKPKNPQEIRICVDMRDANKAILRTRYVTPTIEELSADLSGATVFSKVDLRSGYHQLVLHPSCRYITCFSTHVGLFQYKRLNFGVNSAAEVFQHTIQSLLEGIPGSRNVSDDIIIFGTTQAEHDIALRATLKKLHENGLTINLPKCLFNQAEIEFFGFSFNKNGFGPHPKKIEELNSLQTPKNAAEVRSFLGMAQYSARFIPNFATTSNPLRQLTKQDVTWKWTKECSSAFNKIKDDLKAASFNTHFNPKLETTVYVDASPVGLAAILTQVGQTITCASRSLTSVEQRYSQTEREALAIVWACEHLNIYLCGTEFTVVTDHQALTSIWKKPDPPLRIARWSLRLQSYAVKIIYQPGKNNPADYLSRHPKKTDKVLQLVTCAEDYVSAVAHDSTPRAINLDHVKNATLADETLAAVMRCVQSGKWSTTSDVNEELFQKFRNIRDELTVFDNCILLRSNRIVMPTTLQKRAIELAHRGHQGITKTKALIRSKVWFPYMDAAVEDAVQRCIPCQANRLLH